MYKLCRAHGIDICSKILLLKVNKIYISEIINFHIGIYSTI